MHLDNFHEIIGATLNIFDNSLGKFKNIVLIFVVIST